MGIDTIRDLSWCFLYGQQHQRKRHNSSISVLEGQTAGVASTAVAAYMDLVVALATAQMAANRIGSDRAANVVVYHFHARSLVEHAVSGPVLIVSELSHCMLA